MSNYRDTSREAWNAIKATLASATVDQKIVALLNAYEPGLTHDRMEELTGISHQTLSGNCRHLVEDGLVASSGRSGETRSGRRAILWVSTGQDLARREELKRRLRAADAQGLPCPCQSYAWAPEMGFYIGWHHPRCLRLGLS